NEKRGKMKFGFSKNDLINTVSDRRCSSEGDELVKYLNDTPIEDISKRVEFEEELNKYPAHYSPPRHYPNIN
ncbi:12314_t:CDS:1, partial [Gigaspora rosea]